MKIYSITCINLKYYIFIFPLIISFIYFIYNSKTLAFFTSFFTVKFISCNTSESFLTISLPITSPFLIGAFISSNLTSYVEVIVSALFDKIVTSLVGTISILSTFDLLTCSFFITLSVDKTISNLY